MANPPDPSRYKVVHSGNVRKRVKELAEIARAAGKLEEFHQDFLIISDHLQIEPLAWAGLKLPSDPWDYECFACFRDYTLQYLVLEQQKVVEILEINVITLK